MYLDMVRKCKATLERAIGDPAIDEITVLLIASSFLRPVTISIILLGGDVELVGLKAGDRQLDAVIIVARS